MALEINYRQVTNAEQAFNLVKKNITPEVIGKFKINAVMEYDEANRQINAKGKGFNLIMKFLPDKVLIDLDVSFLLKAIRGTAMNKIEKLLGSIL